MAGNSIMDGYSANAFQRQYAPVQKATRIQFPAKLINVAVQHYSGEAGRQQAIQQKTDALPPIHATDT